MRFIWPAGDNTTMHIQEHDRIGNPLGRSICGQKYEGRYQSCNMPLGQAVCEDCRAEAETI